MTKLKKVNSFSVLKLDISNKKEMPSVVNFITSKILYIREIIQNTILSIKKYRIYHIFSENDSKLSITILTELYEKNKNLYNTITEDIVNYSTEEMIDNLQQIIDKLSVIICGFGTLHITDLLFVSFGTEFKNMKQKNDIIQSKYDLFTNIGEKHIDLKKIYTENHILKQKSHYTESKLIKLLETHGIGRPSTYAMLIDKIKTKGYVEKTNVEGFPIECTDYILENNSITKHEETKIFGNEKNKLVITPMGLLVIEFCLKYFDMFL